MAATPSKPHVKFASTLVMLGMALFALERFGLSRMEGPTGAPIHIDPNLLSVLVLAPIALIAVGAIVFVIGSMRRR
jgi:hypothetical protein